MEKKIKHLEMIEKIIERMAQNSFKLKGWAITLTTLLGALDVKNADKHLTVLAIIPITMFWFLDSFYLKQERRYRCLYREVRETEEEHISFNMNTELVCYSEKEQKRICFWNCFRSFSESLFYGVLAVTILLVTYYPNVISFFNYVVSSLSENCKFVR